MSIGFKTWVGGFRGVKGMEGRGQLMARWEIKVLKLKKSKVYIYSSKSYTERHGPNEVNRTTGGSSRRNNVYRPKGKNPNLL